MKTTQQKVLELMSWEKTNGFCVTDLVKEKFNCREAEIDNNGDIWIADPQSGHWLSDEDIEAFLAQVGAK